MLLNGIILKMSSSDVVNVTGERECEGREEEIAVQTAPETVED